MWLIDVGSLELRFFNNPPEEYVILSHTWGDNEVLFQDMKAEDKSLARGKKGWEKIQYTCDQARKNRYQYAWIDSCCIDKSSSAELSEAINSMFRWYNEASCCYAYLEDYEIPRGAGRRGGSSGVEFEVTLERLARCRWFTRGWTLQELIAPRNMVFYGRGWSQLGTKETLQHMLSEITGVDEEVLELMEYMFDLPAGRRMSWAARRETTREEDMAYCLLGIFNVNIPLLYGEGDRAFVRLQEEIVRRHNDVSLFAWRQEEPVPLYRGLFAQFPSEFAHCAHLVARTTTDGFFSGSRLAMTDDGLAITPRSPSKEEKERKKISMLLQRDLPEVHGLELSHVFDFSAERDGRRGCNRVGIRLQKFGDAYVRARPDILESPARFTTCLEPSGGGTESQASTISTPLHAKTTLSPARSIFIELMLQRKIFLLYRRKLVRNLLEMNCHSPKPTSLSSLDASAKDILELNRITAVHCPVVAREYDLGVGGDPIWWDNLVVVVGDGENGLRVRLTVVCGIPARPDAPSERVLPWFAIFSDRRSGGGRRPSSSGSSRNGNEEAMDGAALVSYLHGLPPREAVDRETQRYVSDIIFEQYADNLGNIMQERMPTVVMLRDRAKKVYEIRINRLGSNASSTFAADVQYIARGDYHSAGGRESY